MLASKIQPNQLKKFILQIYVRSTNLNRILASAQAVMEGLFSSERLGLDIPSKQNSSTLPSHWIPVPVHAPVPFLKDRVQFVLI